MTKDTLLFGAGLTLPYVDDYSPLVIDVTNTATQIVGSDLSGDTTQQIINIGFLLLLKFIPILINKIFSRKKKGVADGI